MSKNTIAEDLRAHLLDLPEVSAIVGQRVHRNHVPDTTATRPPYIWFMRTARQSMNGLTKEDDEITETQFDVECIGTDLDQTDDLADSIIDNLEGHRGNFGTRNVKGVFVSDVDDDYEPKGRGDLGLHYSAVRIRIFHNVRR